MSLRIFTASVGVAVMNVPGSGADSMPASSRFGVERVVVACQFGDGISEPLRASLCDQVVGEFRRHGSYPVVLAAQALNPDPLSDLRINVAARIAPSVAAQSRSLVVSIQPDHRAATSGLPLGAAQTGRTPLLKDGSAPGAKAMITKVVGTIMPKAAANRLRIPQPKKAD